MIRHCLSFFPASDLVCPAQAVDLGKLKWRKRLRQSFNQNTLKNIAYYFFPYLDGTTDFLKDSVKSKTEIVNKAKSEIFCRVFTVLKGFLDEAFPILRMGILTSTKQKKTAELPKEQEKKEVRETGANSRLTRN